MLHFWSSVNFAYFEKNLSTPAARHAAEKDRRGNHMLFSESQPLFMISLATGQLSTKRLKVRCLMCTNAGRRKESEFRLFFPSLLPHSNCPTFSPSSSALGVVGRSSFGSDRRLPGAMQRFQKLNNFFKKKRYLMEILFINLRLQTYKNYISIVGWIRIPSHARKAVAENSRACEENKKEIASLPLLCPKKG